MRDKQVFRTKKEDRIGDKHGNHSRERERKVEREKKTEWCIAWDIILTKKIIIIIIETIYA